MDIAVNLLVGLAVGTLVAVLQMRTREYTARRLRTGLVLSLVGAAVLLGAASGVPVPALSTTLVVVGLVVAAVLGVVRGRTMDLWSAEGRVWTRGTRSTAALWVVGFAVHLGLDVVVRLVEPGGEALSSSSALLFVGLTLGAQAWALARRVPDAVPGAAPVAPR